MILKTFGRASNKQTMPGYLTPVMLEVPVALKMSEICGFIITNHCLILYPSIYCFIHKIDTYCSNIQISDNMVVKVKELQELIIAMPVGKTSGYDHISNEHFKYANEK